jgi:thiol-disulfide isomerase/thioredoxin
MALSALSLAGATALAAQDGKGPSPKEKPTPSLEAGDLAPALNAGKWLQGEEVRAFEAGKVYVVEFWSTSCGPCIALMPHLAELQRRYKGKGVMVVGLTAEAFGDTEEKAAAFVKKRGPKLGYRFAFATGRTFDDWMKATGRSGIPCTFVVDKTGRIAYVGNPFYLQAVLPKVVAGTSKAKAIGKEMAKIQDEFGAVSGALTRGPEACLRALEKFEARHPSMADFFLSVKLKLSLLPKYGKPGEAKDYAGALLAKATKREDQQVLALASSILRQGHAKGEKDLVALAVKAAEAQVRITGGKDARTLLELADAYFVSGDKVRAKEYARKALGASDEESSTFKQYVEKEARRLGAKH